MGPVVLNGEQRDMILFGQSGSFTGGKIIRMQIAYIEGRLQTEQVGICLKRAGIMSESFRIFQISDMGAQEDFVPPAESKGGFLFRAHGKDSVSVRCCF